MSQIIGTEVTDDVLGSFSGGRSCRVQITRDSDGNIVEVRTTGNCGHVSVQVK